MGNVYEELLGRAADPAGFAYWSTVLAVSGDRQAVVRGILGSSEYATWAIKGFYLDLLGRAPDPAGLAGFESMAAAGTSLEAIKSLILSSDEYFQRQAARPMRSSPV